MYMTVVARELQHEIYAGAATLGILDVETAAVHGPTDLD